MAEGKARVLLLGAGGQLGMQLKTVLAPVMELVSLGRADLDLSDIAAVRQAVDGAFGAAGPEYVVNAAAYTAVDKAESEPERARLVNATAPRAMAEELRRVSNGRGWLIHYSTDYVFDGSGTERWDETDATGPLNVYGQTKLEGEQSIAATGCRHVVLRTSWVYAAEGKNFLHTMLRLGKTRSQLSVVDDQIGSPTTAEALAEATRQILGKLGDSEASGVYHLACGGATSWCGFAKAIFAEFAEQQTPPEVSPISTESYPTPARRPKNSRLNCEKVKAQFGVVMPEWEEALRNVAAVVKGRG
jgi:dTDP-4-dehydrorhamnose reductase